MRKIMMFACLGGAALALSATRSEARMAGEPYTDDIGDGHISSSTCSISNGFGDGGGGSIGNKDNWVGDGGSGIIHDGGACAGDGGSNG